MLNEVIDADAILFYSTNSNTTMRGSKLHSAFVRRREIEQMKIEKSAAVDKYFDKWGKITSRFEQWTAPEFYKQADEVNKQRELNQIKNDSLESRREKLKKLLDYEKCEQEMMMKGNVCEWYSGNVNNDQCFPNRSQPTPFQTIIIFNVN